MAEIDKKNKPEEQQEEQARVPMRQQLRDRFKQDYPEDDYDTDEDGELLGGRIMDRLNANNEELTKRRGDDDKLRQLFASNAATGRFFTRWAAGEDPLNLYAEVFGDKLIETLQAEDGAERVKKGMEKYFANIKANDEASELFETNANETMATIEKMEAEEGISDEVMQKALDLGATIGTDMAVGKITPENLRVLLKAVTHDEDVTNAMNDGKAMGRNERYTENVRQRQRGDGQPAAATGGGSRVNPDRQVRRPEEEQGRRSAWDAEEKRTVW